MIIDEKGYQPMQRQRKSLFPFVNGMRSVEFKGVGANIAENVWFRDGRITKMLGSTTFKTIAGISSIVFIDGFQQYDATWQTIVCYEDSGYYKFRAIEEDGTIIVPGTESQATQTGTVTATEDSTTIAGVGTAFTTEFEVGDWVRFLTGDGVYYRVTAITSDTDMTIGVPYAGTTVAGSAINIITNPKGVGEVLFSSSEFSFETILSRGYVGNNAAGNSLFRWDGAALAPVATQPQFIHGLARDGKRLAVITPDGAEASTDSIDLNFTDVSLGVLSSAKYGTSIRAPRAIVTAGMGVIIVGETASEAHKVVPNNASDEISADTKIDNYNDRELGVQLNKQAVMGNSFVWRLTKEGIMRTNPFNGETVNVTDFGKMRRYWTTKVDTTDGSIGYDEENEQVVASVKVGGQNDTLICIDSTKEDMPISVKTSAYYASLGTINNQLYGGGSRDGTIDKLFLTRTESDAGNVVFRYISEWDELASQLYWKNFKRMFIAANLSPSSSMTVKIYFDGETDASYTETFTTQDTTEATSGDAPYGIYQFRGGGFVDLVEENSDEAGESKKTKRFSTVAIEIYENSGADFTVHDVIFEYKSKNKFYHSFTHKNVLFD